MSELEELLNRVDSSMDYGENALVINFLVQTIKSSEEEVSKEDSEIIKNFAVSEAEKLNLGVPVFETYKEKDTAYGYYNCVLALLALAEDKAEFDEEDKAVLGRVAEVFAEERTIESAMSALFEHEIIIKEDVADVLKIVRPETDEYKRGAFFNELLNREEELSKFDEGAKKSVGLYAASEIERFIGLSELSDDAVNVLEIVVDISRYFICPKLVAALKNVFILNEGGVLFFAVETLLTCGEDVPASVTAKIARDLRFAYLLFCMLNDKKRPELFPKELATAEYLAKSDIVQWLAYPTELGKEPDEIELLGTAESEGDIYHVFKYKSNSDNLDEYLRNEWLVGWSSTGGNTFSEFEPLSQYEDSTPKKTIDNVMKDIVD